MGSGVTASAVGLTAALGLWGGAVHAACSPSSLDIRGAFGTARFHVEVVDTAADRNRGLMYRETMAAAAGMLFVYEQPQSVAFWMKNTLIPLDMVFADATGRVTRIHSNAVPGDLTPIPGGDGVQYVLEINGGMAKRLGLTEGVELRHPSIASDLAAWPCE